MKNINFKKKKSEAWFRDLRTKICEMLEEFERTHGISDKFKKTYWKRNPESSKNQGGGEISLLRGKIFEKAGVNISTVYGKFDKKFQKHIPGAEKDPTFWASGISVVIHPFSPLIPAVHMNTRFIITSKHWFGGGADLTPTYKDTLQSKKVANLFHNYLKKTCNKYKLGSYMKYKKWCDEYFFLPHRKETRGLGGIFYDYLDSNDWQEDFRFTQNVGKTFLKSYKKIVKATIDQKWTKKDKNMQLFRRSRYVEFNLLFDRGTKFGIMTNGNPDAILMSLPPQVAW